MAPRLIDAARLIAYTPRSFLKAAEFEDRDFGTLKVDGRDILYTDHHTGAVLLRTTWASIREAKLQLQFYRDTYKDVKDRRAAFRLVNPEMQPN